MHESTFARARFWASVAGWSVFLAVIFILGFNLFVQLEKALAPLRNGL